MSNDTDPTPPHGITRPPEPPTGAPIRLLDVLDVIDVVAVIDAADPGARGMIAALTDAGYLIVRRADQ